MHEATITNAEGKNLAVNYLTYIPLDLLCHNVDSLAKDSRVTAKGGINGVNEIITASSYSGGHCEK